MSNIQHHEIRQLIANANEHIDNCTEAEIKADMKLLTNSLIEFVAGEDPRILLPSTPSDQIGKLFFKMIGGIATDAIGAMAIPMLRKKLEARFDNILKLWPLLKKYSNVQE